MVRCGGGGGGGWTGVLEVVEVVVVLLVVVVMRGVVERVAGCGCWGVADVVVVAGAVLIPSNVRHWLRFGSVNREREV